MNTQAGTFGHELGHTLGLQHGGGDSINCKPNYQSVMSYQNQVRLLHGFDGNTYFDYSGQALPPLAETSLNESLGLGFSNGAPLATTYLTRWYAPLNNNFLYSQLNTIVGAPVAARIHCEGTPITDGAQMVRLQGPLVPGAIDWNNNGTTNTAADVGFAQDINFNNNNFNPAVAGFFDSPFAGYNDWASLDLRQIGGAPGVFGYSGDVWGAFDNSGPGGTTKPIGTGGVTGAMVAEGDGGTTRPIGTGGTTKPIGTGGQEADFDQANSTVDPPISVGVKQVSKTVVVTWAPPGFGRIRTYYIWRANTTNGPISATNLPVNIGKR